MSQITKVKKDSLGLYVTAGGYCSRPFFGTCFKEGEEVKTKHVGGSRMAYVTTSDRTFRNGDHEFWSTTGMSIRDLKNKSQEELREKVDLYRSFNSEGETRLMADRNLEFSSKLDRKIS